MFDIIKVLYNLNVPYTTKGKNLSLGRVGVCCPFCGDTGYHGAFTEHGEIYTCWKCGCHKTIETLIELSGRDYYGVKILIEEYDDQLSLIRTLHKKKSCGENLILPGSTLDKPYRDYLIKRKFDPDILIKKYGITAGGPVGEWKFRIIIPIYYEGQLVSWQGRDITGQQELRYKTLSTEKSVVDPKSILYDIDNCKKDYIGVCEGVFDKFRLGDDFVATLGTSMRESQYRLLSIYKKIYIVFDPEETAQLRAKKVAERLSIFGIKVEIVNTELDHDPGDMTEEEAKNLRKELNFR